MKILVVDDDRISLALIERAIQNPDDEIILESNGRSAWEFCQKHKVSIVVSDWMMPELDGMELCRRIRAADAGYYTYIIILSGAGDKDDQVTMLGAGADDFIAKPFNPKELLARIATGKRVIRLENQHKQMQSIIIESRDKIRTVFDSLHEEIVTIDRQLIVLSANKYFADEIGMAERDIFGKPFYDVLKRLNNEAEANSWARLVMGCLKKGRREMNVVAIKSPKGRDRIKELSCLPVTNANGDVIQVILVGRDITEDREKSRRINDLNQKLTTAIKEIKQKNITLESTLNQLKESQLRTLQAEKMASIGQLAAGVAHEINNPTGYVSSNLKTLADYQKGLLRIIPLYRQLVAQVKRWRETDVDSSALVDLADQILKSERDEDMDFILDDMPPLISESREGTQRIKKIVSDLKEFSHPGERAKIDADINENIETTLNIVWNEIKYKAQVTKDFGELPLVRCYPQRINQVFMNILVNAAHAIEENGSIHIQTRCESGLVRIVISDNGCGMSQESLPKIFDPFYTTKAVGKGTGLGLHLAYNIIMDHGGVIDVQSEVGKGTSFIIDLPIDSKDDRQTQQLTGRDKYD